MERSCIFQIIPLYLTNGCQTGLEQHGCVMCVITSVWCIVPCRSGWTRGCIGQTDGNGRARSPPSRSAQPVSLCWGFWTRHTSCLRSLQSNWDSDRADITILQLSLPVSSSHRLFHTELRKKRHMGFSTAVVLMSEWLVSGYRPNYNQTCQK